MTSQMLIEIHQQPEALRATQIALRAQHAQLRNVASDCRRVLLFARGSSDTAATYGRYLLEVVAGLPAAMGAPSVTTLYGARQDLSGTLAIVCSQSGMTEELVTCAEWARSCGARVVAVTNNAESPLAEVADIAWCTLAGGEQAIPATKSHTTCLLALAELCLALTPTDHPRRAAIESALNDVSRQVELLAVETGSVDVIAKQLVGSSACCIAGRGYSYATALELSLKVEETSSIPCIAMSQADLQHGPIAVLTSGRPLLIASAATGPTIPGLLALAATARHRGSQLVVLGGDNSLRAMADTRLPGPELPEEVAPIALIVPGQLLAESLGRARGFNPDSPPGLSKVTQTL